MENDFIKIELNEQKSKTKTKSTSSNIFNNYFENKTKDCNKLLNF